MPTPYAMACDHKIDSLLATPTLRIIPYARHSGFPPDTLYCVWKAMHDDGILARVFYEEPVEDLESFVAYMQKTVLFVVVTRETPAIVGAAWFTNVTPYRGNVGVWYRKEIQGTYGRDISRRILTYVFHRFGWRHVWGFTPWLQAARHGEKVGFKRIATLPHFVQIGGKLRDLYVICLENTVCLPP